MSFEVSPRRVWFASNIMVAVKRRKEKLDST